MKRVASFLASIGLVAFLSYQGAAQSYSPNDENEKTKTTSVAGAPLFNDLGNYHHKITTNRSFSFETAEEELKALETIVADARIESLNETNLPGGKLIVLSKHALAGELAARRGQTAEMIRHFETAIALEDKLPYMEPPYWHHPVRQLFGAALLKAGKAAEAESVYREDLKRNPANGWSLYGLLASLRAQGKAEEAKQVGKRFREAWRLSDVTLTA